MQNAERTEDRFPFWTLFLKKRKGSTLAELGIVRYAERKVVVVTHSNDASSSTPSRPSINIPLEEVDFPVSITPHHIDPHEPCSSATLSSDGILRKAISVAVLAIDTFRFYLRVHESSEQHQWSGVMVRGAAYRMGMLVQHSFARLLDLQSIIFNCASGGMLIRYA